MIKVAVIFSKIDEFEPGTELFSLDRLFSGQKPYFYRPKNFNWTMSESERSSKVDGTENQKESLKSVISDDSSQNDRSFDPQLTTNLL